MDVADRSFKLDKRMSLVVGVGRNTFTRSAEIGVRADGALVSIAVDPRTTRLIGTQRPITVNTEVPYRGFVSQSRARHGKRIIDGNKAMSVMVKRCRSDAVGAIVPIRASHALVPNTIDLLYSSQYMSKAFRTVCNYSHTFSQPSQMA